MNVFWLEQTESDLPAANDWLSPSEAQRLATMRFPKRRAEWLLGRWTAKGAVSFCLGLSHEPENLARLEIRSGTGGEPEVFLRRSPAGASLSLSHRARVALSVVAAPGAALGCDLEKVEAHGDAFTADYFTAEEQALILNASPSDRPLLVTLLWSAKESALKALHQGLRLDTRAVVVDLATTAKPSDLMEWSPLRVAYRDGSIFHGCWSVSGDLLRTIVVAAPSLHPIAIDLASNAETRYGSDFLRIRELLQL